MWEYEESSSAPANVDSVFAFISDLRNFPKFVPTTRLAQHGASDHVHLEGDAEGHHYSADGHFRVDAARHRVEWGSEESSYSGWMQVTESSGNSSTVTIHLSFKHEPPMLHDAPPGVNPVAEALQQTLAAIRTLCTSEAAV